MAESLSTALPQATERTAASATHRYVVFRRQGQYFGLGIEYVTEVLPGQPLTRVPRAQGNILGVLSLRGEILPVVRVDEMLDLTVGTDDAALPILVLRWQELLVGLRVDAIQSVITLADPEIHPHPAGRDSHFSGIWHAGGDSPLTLTLLAGNTLLEVLRQQTPNHLSLQTVE
jgi:purine-binding chemotaxis protein CheW